MQLKKKYGRVTEHLRDKITLLQATNKELELEKEVLQYVVVVVVVVVVIVAVVAAAVVVVTIMIIIIIMIMMVMMMIITIIIMIIIIIIKKQYPLSIVDGQKVITNAVYAPMDIPMEQSCSYRYTWLHIYTYTDTCTNIYRHINKIAHTHITNLPILLHLHMCIGIYIHWAGIACW